MKIVDSVVYAIADKVGNIKIGLTRGNPAARMNELQTGNASRLSVVGVSESVSRDYAKQAEDELHGLLISLGRHASGEWFAPGITTTIIANALDTGSLRDCVQVATDLKCYLAECDAVHRERLGPDHFARTSKEFEEDYMRDRLVRTAT
jgi:hypothetical protein